MALWVYTRGAVECRIQKGKDYTGVTVTYLCHDGAGNILMHKRSERCRDEHGRWDCGGGALEFEDTIEDTLKKEVREEYGTEVLDFEFLGYRDVHREHDGKKTHWVALDFKVLVDPAQVVNNEPHKFEEVAWFTKDALPEPLHSQLPGYFERYREQLN